MKLIPHSSKLPDQQINLENPLNWAPKWMKVNTTRKGEQIEKNNESIIIVGLKKDWILIIFRKEQPKIGEVLRKAPLRHPTQIAGQLPPQLRPVIPASSTKYNIALHSARNTFNTSLKNAELREGTTTSDVLKIPSPESLNRQIPPLLHHLATPTTSSAPSHVLQDTLREEEEAAAALASLK